MKKIVYLDPGHGGSDPGAIGPSGLKESEMALDVCKRTKKLLDPFVDCRLTRDDDIFIPLSARPKMANSGNADVFVSYHFNSAGSPDTKSSFEIFTTRGQNRSDILASCIGEEHGKQFQDQFLRADYQDGDIDKEANFAVIRGTDHPSCLVEGEFIHTVHGEQLIKNPANRQKMAVAVTRGILTFLDIPFGNVTPASFGSAPLTVAERLDRLESLHPELKR